MKKIAALILAAALVLSMAGCSENAEGTAGNDISTVSQKPDSSYADPSSRWILTDRSDPDSGKDDPSSGKDSSSVKDPDSSKDDKLTPATTEIEDLIKQQYTDLSFFSKAEDYDNATQIRRYFEGEITEDSTKNYIFKTFCKILKESELTLKGKQAVQGGSSVILTLKTKDSREYKLCKGLLVQDPMEEGGEEVYILKAPQSRYYYFRPDIGDKRTLECLLQNGVMTMENLVKTVMPQDRDTPDKKQLVKPENPIAFMSVRSNYAWGFSLHGSCIDTAGNVYSFDFSSTNFKLERKNSTSFEQLVLDYINKVGVEVKGKTMDTNKLREALSYASKVDPDAEITEEHKMCDYGQNTIYAVVDGKPIMLQSKGDVDKTVHDDNAQKAIEFYESLMSSAVAPEAGE